ncbi:MAG: hypothetical protein WBM91_00145, partial [Eudoraea sp.]|uniref:hypothetical protein n=1 Tax=Eudoraea sp. TaxID=1979955 RepID=UPI003C726D52
MKLRLLLLVFLVSGFAFAQTTVTLQDQCNCEVLSGTAVNAAGAINPTGADTGDIYVNTNTGTIYFWDGDSWELTSTDDQQLQNFNFNGATNTLTLDIEDGNSVSVDLSSLSNSGTDDQALSLAGNILTLEDGGTVNLAPYLDNTDDQTITAFSIDAANILTITLESGNTRTVDLSALVGTDDQTAAEVNYDNTTSLLTATNVQDAIDELTVGSTDDQNLTGATLDGANQLQIDIENGSSTTVDLSSLVETVIAGTGAISVTDDGNGNYTVNSTDPDEDLTNELTLIGPGVPVVIPSNAGVTYVDSVAGQLYIYDGAAWQAVGGSSSPDLDGDPTNEQNTAFAVNAGNLEITDSGGTLSVPLASLGTDDQDISTNGTAGNITIEDGSTLVLNVDDADSSVTNEINTVFAVNGTDLEITDSNGTLSVPLASLGTDDQDIDVLTLNGA